jgi:hypothetical protein
VRRTCGRKDRGTVVRACGSSCVVRDALVCQNIDRRCRMLQSAALVHLEMALPGEVEAGPIRRGWEYMPRQFGSSRAKTGHPSHHRASQDRCGTRQSDYSKRYLGRVGAKRWLARLAVITSLRRGLAHGLTSLKHQEHPYIEHSPNQPNIVDLQD